MVRRTRLHWFWAVQSLTIARVGLTFGFVVISPFPDMWAITGTMYLCALLADFFDGRLARAKEVASKFGGALDIFGDRYFLVISCLYVGFRGVSLIPLSIILLRELYSVALRMVQINGIGVMLSNRKLGGVVHVLVAVGTIGFIISPNQNPSRWFYAPFYIIAAFYVFYLPYSILRSRQKIRASITADLCKTSEPHYRSSGA
ncbi:MAG: CDP-alcohol phosphatidyltransferase family protein [Longimicrobiaceae bacterium]